MSKRRKNEKPKGTLERWPGGVSLSGSLEKPAHPRYPFVVRWPGADGKRLARWFSNSTEAQAWAKEKSEEAGELGSAFGSLSEDERGAVAAYRRLVNRCEDAPPPAFVEVVREFSARWEASRSGATVAGTVPAFLEAKEAEGQSKGHLDTLGVRLGRFVADHGPRVLASFTSAEISDYVLGLRGEVLVAPRERKPGARKLKDRPKAEKQEALLSLETRAGYRAALHSFFAWAEHRGFLDGNPVTKAAKPKPKPKLPGVLTPGEAAAFFAALASEAPRVLPFWAVRAFAGIREAEAARMDWGMVDLPKRRIVLPGTITKTGKPREITIQPALAAFLEPVAKESGKLCTLSPMARRWDLRLAMRKLPDLKLPRNWARHSFATYHLLAFRHAGETAMQLGHKGGPELLHARYAGVGTEKAAGEYWKIRPAKPAENVVSMAEDQPEADPKPARKQPKARKAQ